MPQPETQILIEVVKGSLVGSIVSNLLLVLGTPAVLSGMMSCMDCSSYDSILDVPEWSLVCETIA